jgi:hypothetical protein
MSVWWFAPGLSHGTQDIDRRPALFCDVRQCSTNLCKQISLEEPPTAQADPAEPGTGFGPAEGTFATVVEPNVATR